MTTDSEPRGSKTTAEQGESTKELVRIFTRVLRRLGETGHADEASRFAGRAWSAVRHADPDAAAHINGTMHYLARLPDPIDTPHSDHSLRALANNDGPDAPIRTSDD